MGMKQKANMSGEKYLKAGRTEGQTGTHGKERKGGVEKTVPGKPDQSDSGSVQPDLTSAARSMYQDAVHNRGDKLGDKALLER